MRRKKYVLLIIALLMIGLITSCNMKKKSNGQVKPADNASEQSAELKKNEAEKVMVNYKALLLQNKEPFEIVKFIDENIAKVDQNDAVNMIEEFLNVQEKFIQGYTDEISKDDRQSLIFKVCSEPEFDFKKINEIKDEELKNLLTKIIDGKYKLVNIEGSCYPIIDYEAIGKYNKYLTDEMKGYIDIKAKESNEPSMMDAALVISWDELANRMLGVEKYLVKYPEGIKEEELTRLYGNYLVVYLSGTDNSPIYNYETKKIFDDVLNSYKKLVATNKGTITGDTVKKYIELIANNKNIIDENVTSKIIELHNEAIARIEEHK